MNYIDLTHLGAGRVPGVPPSLGKYYEQTAVVRLESVGHSQRAELDVTGDVSNTYTMIWASVSDQVRMLLDDADTTTENGALGIAFIVISLELGFAVGPAHGKAGEGGFDYWLVNEGGTRLTARLEVAGRRRRTMAEVRSLTLKKLRQIEPSDSWGYPGYVIVVEFSHPLAMVRTK